MQGLPAQSPDAQLVLTKDLFENNNAAKKALEDCFGLGISIDLANVTAAFRRVEKAGDTEYVHRAPAQIPIEC